MAKRENGIIINADASQCYTDLSIVSARPQEHEMDGVLHRLYGFADAAHALSTAEWAKLAKAEIAKAHAAGKVPILVGGTGMYLRTLLTGIAPVPEIDPDIRHAVRALDTAALATALGDEDPVMAARLNPNDQQRMARALEVKRSSGQSLSVFHADRVGGIENEVDLRAVVVDVNRDILVDRCAKRFDAMMEAGALEEVRRLAARRLAPTLPAMKAIGVPPLLAHLAGSMTLDDAIERAKLDTRRYAKRQRTWFTNQTPDWPRVTT